jgi:hypothetical protein
MHGLVRTGEICDCGNRYDWNDDFVTSIVAYTHCPSIGRSWVRRTCWQRSDAFDWRNESGRNRGHDGVFVFGQWPVRDSSLKFQGCVCVHETRSSRRKGLQLCRSLRWLVHVCYIQRQVHLFEFRKSLHVVVYGARKRTTILANWVARSGLWRFEPLQRQ